MRRLALINQKGGVGKTTTAVNLGAALAERGRRVVLVDLDPQGNLSTHLGLRVERGQPSTYTLLVDDAPFAACLRDTHIQNLRVVPTNLDLSGAELELAAAIGRESLLRDALDAWEQEQRTQTGAAPADYVLFDCPPSLGLLSVNGLVAAREVLIAVQTEFFALQGMSKLMEIVQLLKRRLNPQLSVSGIAACLYDNRLRLAREVLGELRRYFPGLVYPTTIAANVKLAEAPSFAQTIFQYAPESIGARDYRRLAEDVIAQEGRDAELLARFGNAQVAAPASAPPALAPAKRAKNASVVLTPAPRAAAPKSVSPLAPADMPELPPEAFEVRGRQAPLD